MAHKNTLPVAVAAAAVATWRKVRLRLCFRFRRAASARCASSLCTEQRLSATPSAVNCQPSAVRRPPSAVCRTASMSSTRLYTLALTPLAKPTRCLSRLIVVFVIVAADLVAHTEHAAGARVPALVCCAERAARYWNDQWMKCGIKKQHFTFVSYRYEYEPQFASSPACQPTNKPLNPLPERRSFLGNANTQRHRSPNPAEQQQTSSRCSPLIPLAVTHSIHSACVGVAALAGRLVGSLDLNTFDALEWVLCASCWIFVFISSWVRFVGALSEICLLRLRSGYDLILPGSYLFKFITNFLFMSLRCLTFIYISVKHCYGPQIHTIAICSFLTTFNYFPHYFGAFAEFFRSTASSYSEWWWHT